MNQKLIISIIFLVILTTTFGCQEKKPTLNNDKEFNVKEFGAKGDSITLETQFIQAAINACSKAEGGIVIFPSGTYRTGTIFFKNNVTLRITKDAKILGSTNLNDYPRVKPNYIFYGSEWRDQSLIYGENLHNIAIEGEGTIDGQGGSFIIANNKKPFRYMDRPYGIWLTQCKDIRIENINLRNSAFWMQHYLACDNLTIKGITVYNHSNKNNDMMDIDGCHNVVISDCVGDSDDDGITIKSTSKRLNKNILIENCTVSSHCNAIKMGTESVGGFKNITIRDCVIKPSASKTKIYGEYNGDGGLALEVVDGGVMDSIHIFNIKIDGPEVPLFIRLGNRARKFKKGIETPPVGSISNIILEDITATGGNHLGSSITGLPGYPIENIVLKNINLNYNGGGKKEDINKIVEELPQEYPEGNMFGNLPSYGLFVRHVKQITIKDLDLSYKNPEERHPLKFDDVNGLDINGLNSDISKDLASCIILKDVENVKIKDENCVPK